MKSNHEIRKSVSATLLNRWFWRVLLVMAVLGAFPQIVSRILDWAFAENGIQTWQGFLQSWAAAHNSGLDYAVPSLRVAAEMTGSTLFLLFMVYVFMAISAFGVAIAALKAARNDVENWFAGSLVGFRRPLELLWFLVVMNLRVLLWSLLFVVPGVIAVYRYRNGWFLKVEHPDWSVSRCLAESGRMMQGRKGQAFCLDLYYLVWMVLALVLWLGLLVGSASLGSGILRVVTAVFPLLAFFMLMKQIVALTVARAEFYQELKAECSSNSSESSS